MLEKLYKKSEVWFAVVFILVYVIGNSFLLQASERTGIEMVYTIPFNFIILGIMFLFIRKNHLFQYYGIQGAKCKAKSVLYYIPLVMIASVNLWMGICFKMDALHSTVYFVAMIFTGIVEEMLFRGFLLAAVLIVSKSIIPCMITHAMLNALGTFSNETALDKIQISVSLALCVISGVSAYLIYRNYKREKSGEIFLSQP